MNTNHVPLTDSQWQRLEIFFSKTSTRGRKRQVSMRQVVDELLYIVQTGVQWRNLRSNISWQTIYYYFILYKPKIYDILQAIQSEHIKYETTAIDTKDYEKLPESSAAFIVLAFLQMILNRLR